MGWRSTRLGRPRGDVVSHGKESEFNSVFNRKPLENYKPKSDIKFTFKKKKKKDRKLLVLWLPCEEPIAGEG